jgi:hypothetical protein
MEQLSANSIIKVAETIEYSNVIPTIATQRVL